METCQSQVQPAPRPQSSNARPASENNNNITLSFPQQQLPQACGDNVKAITLQPQPIQLHVDTPTDWPSVASSLVVGMAGAFIAVKVGVMTSQGQKNQVRASTANFRHAWQQEFKQNVGKFVSAVTRLNFELIGDKKYNESKRSEYIQICCNIIECQALIDVMLDRSKSYYDEISSTSSRIVEAAKKGDITDFEDLMNKFVDIANRVVEKTWQDMRDDIEGDGDGNKWWSRLFW